MTNVSDESSNSSDEEPPKWSKSMSNQLREKLDKQKDKLLLICRNIGLDQTDEAIESLIENSKRSTKPTSPLEALLQHLGIGFIHHFKASEFLNHFTVNDDVKANDKGLFLFDDHFDAANIEIENVKMAVNLHNLQIEAVKGQKFSPARKKGSITPQTKYINDLVMKNPGLSAKILQIKSDEDSKSPVKGMTQATFANKVSAARKLTK